jgi:hypothetical protein
MELSRLNTTQKTKRVLTACRIYIDSYKSMKGIEPERITVYLDDYKQLERLAKENCKQRGVRYDGTMYMQGIPLVCAG